MEYYCAMVLTGEEKKFKEYACREFSQTNPEAQFYYFERKLFTKKRGWFLGSLFPGYVFFCVERLTADFFTRLKKVKGFCRILPRNDEPLEITGAALEELSFLIKNGEVMDVSKVLFLPNQLVKAVSGPLKGYEGKIVMVNKKKKQITVQSTLTNDGKKFDLLYEDVEVVE